MDNKSTLLTILKVVVTFLMLASCTPVFQTPTPSDVFSTITPVPYPVWLTNWLEKPTCAPPCWENIIPGKTTRQDARITLSKVPGISSIIDTEVDEYGKRYIYWNRGSMYFDSKDIVNRIAFGTGYMKMPLNDLLVHYGSPKYVVFFGRDTGGAYIDIAYSESGLVVSLYITDLKYVPDGSGDIIVNITPEEEVIDISFYVPGLEYYYSLAWGQPPIKQKYDWKGYTSYP